MSVVTAAFELFLSRKLYTETLSSPGHPDDSYQVLGVFPDFLLSLKLIIEGKIFEVTHFRNDDHYRAFNMASIS